MINNIYISSIAFGGKDCEYIINTAKENNWSIEFSSSLPYHADMEKIFLSAPIIRMPHNYFPAQINPFVLNLASNNPEIRERSIKHCINGLYLSKKANSPFFAAHSGFCIDPIVTELGKKINHNGIFNKQVNWQLFFDSLQQVLIVANELEIDFLVENNVITAFNMKKDCNPLLCCESQDIEFLFKIKHPRLGLLLDTAHLKVSCLTLGLDIRNEVKKMQPYIRAIHHSDNDGTIDDNQALNKNYWFLPFLSLYEDLIHVIEVKNIEVNRIQEQINLLQYYAT